MIIGELRSERLSIFEHLKDSGATEEPSVLRNHSQGSNLVYILDVKGLLAAIVVDVPNLHHSLCVTGYKDVQVTWAVHSHQGGLVTIQLNYVFFTVGVPDEYLEVKAAADQDLVSL